MECRKNIRGDITLCTALENTPQKSTRACECNVPNWTMPHGMQKKHQGGHHLMHSPRKHSPKEHQSLRMQRSQLDNATLNAEKTSGGTSPYAQPSKTLPKRVPERANATFPTGQCHMECRKNIRGDITLCTALENTPQKSTRACECNVPNWTMPHGMQKKHQGGHHLMHYPRKLSPKEYQSVRMQPSQLDNATWNAEKTSGGTPPDAQPSKTLPKRAPEPVNESECRERRGSQAQRPVLHGCRRPALLATDTTTPRRPQGQQPRTAALTQQIPQAGPVDGGPAYDSRYTAERSGAAPASTPRTEAPDSRQGAAKPADPAHGAQQPTAEAEPRKRKPSVLLFLACSVAFIALAVAVILVYTFGSPATARRLKSPRFCGDVPSWRTNRLKNDFMKCSEESCSKIVCGPINDTWCLTGAPPFENKCECCDWCIVRDLVCGKRARVSSGSNPYASCQTSCGRL
ncbi:uncharacterized protein LOC119437697 [Dermacentor silvarum]|uniref:uncharacterized protein LOC119437697 n=1 Tax=Dermacentor silvarum TaxID=543639 RepID=UPI002101C3FE|nr:uncharacterized protein LOC119437697 [Dermacentor silvarum]